MSAAASAAGLLEKLEVPLDPELLVLALTHRSFSHENGGVPTNERLEFLGDAVLGLVVTEALYRRHPDLSEGDLAKMRAATVSQKALAAVARSLGLGQYVLLGRGETRSRGFNKDSILSDTLEALFGAVYSSHGLEVARALVHRLVGPTLTAAADMGAGLDWKTSLQELAAATGLGPPVYTHTSEGPDHARIFTSSIRLDGKLYGVGRGTAKKHAEQEAAKSAYKALTDRGPGVAAAAGQGAPEAGA